MLTRALPLFAGLAPFLGVSAAYLLGARAGVIPECMPYVDGCTSISSTGRHLPGSLAFRATLFPQAAVLGILWWLAADFLRALGEPRYSRFIRVSGLVSAVALILYVTFLGTEASFYEFMRRVGIYFYFLGTGLCQLLFALSLHRSRLQNAMLATALFPWAVGIINLIQKSALTQPNNIENIIEWWASLSMQLWFVMLYLLWRRDGFVLTVSRGRTSAPP